MEKTAVEWIYEKLKRHFQQDKDHLEAFTRLMSMAKEKEREQHGRTWNAAIDQHERRGHVHSRSISDFDEYVIT